MTMPRKNDLFVDTAGWGYYLNYREPFYTAVITFVQGQARRRHRLITTNYVIAELVALLSGRYHFPRQEVITAINNVKADGKVEVVYIDQPLDDEAWRLLEARPDKEWSLVDATSFVVMKRFGMAQALTTDHHFAQAGFTRVPVL
jgi:uncharacterized protein